MLQAITVCGMEGGFKISETVGFPADMNFFVRSSEERSMCIVDSISRLLLVHLVMELNDILRSCILPNGVLVGLMEEFRLYV